MSIASEYAARVAAAREEPKRFKPAKDQGTMHAYVDASGDCQSLGGWITPAEAIKLAEWILETFSEPTPKGQLDALIARVMGAP